MSNKVHRSTNICWKWMTGMGGSCRCGLQIRGILHRPWFSSLFYLFTDPWDAGHGSETKFWPGRFVRSALSCQQWWTFTAVCFGLKLVSVPSPSFTLAFVTAKKERIFFHNVLCPNTVSTTHFQWWQNYGLVKMARVEKRSSSHRGHRGDDPINVSLGSVNRPISVHNWAALLTSPEQ